MQSGASLWLAAGLAIGILGATGSQSVCAQQPGGLEKPPTLAPAPPPPKISTPGNGAKESGPEVDDTEPVVTIRQEGGNRIEEFRIHGRLYAVRVTPPVGKPYTMVDPDGKGGMGRVESGADDPAGASVKPPRWVLFEF
jgi:hypothetical protein